MAVSLRERELTVTVEADMKIVYLGKDCSWDVVEGCWQDREGSLRFQDNLLLPLLFFHLARNK